MTTLGPRFLKSSSASVAGGYGNIEIWHDTSLARSVAIKWTQPEHADQLLSEVRALSQRPSPYIVEIYDTVFDDNGVLNGIVLEHLTGAGFDAVDLSQPGDQSKAFGLLYQMAQGLSDLHKAGLVHRDVKPANAVCTADGRLKIVDFGLSGPSLGAVTLTARGTMGFACPELFGTPPIPITQAMDVYSFGMVCWAKLVGTLPNVGPIGFPDSTHYPLPSIASMAAIPPKLAAIIDLCLAWESGSRPKMQDVANRFLAEITVRKHTACVMMAGHPPSQVTTDPTKVSSINTAHGSIDIGYDGYEFTVRKIHGEVLINNSAAVLNQRLHEGCLLTFGGRGLGGSRLFIPFRQSSPDIVF